MILQASELVKRYTRRGETFAAVDGVSFSLGEGAFVALMGQSGCGKSTLFHLLSGMCRPDSGSVTFAGRELTELDGGKFVLGSDEGTPNITFQRDEGRDSGFAVTGIN